MIKSFKCKETQKLYSLEPFKRLPKNIQKVALRKLELLDYAAELNDLRVPPSNHLEILKGNRKGQYSIRINKQWRICFIWKNKNSYNVEIVDYH
jgi:proteic killer suppression protein